MLKRETMMIPMREKGYGLKSSAESLVNHLMKKLQNPKEEYPLIPELDIYRLEPEDLISMYHDMHGIASGDAECYFFYPLRDRNGSRSTQEGFWRSTGQGRKAQETDQTKWAQRNLVYYRGSQREKVPTDWAMQEYVIESDKSFCLYHIHKKRRNKGSNKARPLKKRQKKGCDKAESCVPEYEPLCPASGEPVESENQNKPEEVTPELLVQEELSCPPDALTDSTESRVFVEPQFPQMYTGERSPYINNASFDICPQQLGSWQYPLDITSELQNNGSLNFHSFLLGQYPQQVFAQSFINGSPNSQSPQYHLPDIFAQSFNNGSPYFRSLHYHLPDASAQLCNYKMPDLLFLCFQYLQNVYARSLNDQSLNLPHPLLDQNLLDVFVRSSDCTPSNIPSPPGYQLLMPMEGMFPSINNGFSNSTGTTTISQVGYSRQARAEMPSLSNDHGAQEISSQEYQQSSVNSQTPMPLQNCTFYSSNL